MIARLLGFRVKPTDRLPPDVDATWRKPTSSRPWAEIYVSNLVGGCRRAFSVGHELLEAHLPLDVANLDESVKEAWCNRGAAALLMPAQAFGESGEACGWDLDTLEVWWPCCSHEAIERRIQDLY